MSAPNGPILLYNLTFRKQIFEILGKYLSAMPTLLAITINSKYGQT